MHSLFFYSVLYFPLENGVEKCYNEIAFINKKRYVRMQKNGEIEA